MENIQVYLDKAIELAIAYAPKVVLALLTLFIGLKLINVLVKFVGKRLEKGKVDETLRPFIANLIAWTLKAMLFISVASMIGIQTTSFVAVLGAAGLAIGLSLQGALSNFAGGVLILLFRPYKIGDLIESQGHLGVVREIQVFTTILSSPENKLIILPNGAVSNGDIVNYTALGKIRVDLTIGIAYDADIKKAREVLIGVMQEHPNILKDPAPFVGVSELADSSVNLAVRPWSTPEDYWTVYFDVLENSKTRLDDASITIPFPQTDVHLHRSE